MPALQNGHRVCVNVLLLIVSRDREGGKRLLELLAGVPLILGANAHYIDAHLFEHPPIRLSDGRRFRSP